MMAVISLYMHERRVMPRRSLHELGFLHFGSGHISPRSRAGTIVIKNSLSAYVRAGGMCQTRYIPEPCDALSSDTVHEMYMRCSEMCRLCHF
jgi:hypothetical protein